MRVSELVEIQGTYCSDTIIALKIALSSPIGTPRQTTQISLVLYGFFKKVGFGNYFFLL